MAMSKDVKLVVDEKFCCRICENRKYYVMVKRGAIGGIPVTIEYYCSECTVVFKDPEKWVKK